MLLFLSNSLPLSLSLNVTRFDLASTFCASRIVPWEDAPPSGTGEWQRARQRPSGRLLECRRRSCSLTMLLLLLVLLLRGRETGRWRRPWIVRGPRGGSLPLAGGDGRPRLLSLLLSRAPFADAASAEEAGSERERKKLKRKKKNTFACCFSFNLLTLFLFRHSEIKGCRTPYSSRPSRSTTMTTSPAEASSRRRRRKRRRLLLRARRRTEKTTPSSMTSLSLLLLLQLLPPRPLPSRTSLRLPTSRS